jgi:hypothetical protein
MDFFLSRELLFFLQSEHIQVTAHEKGKCVEEEE